MDQDRIMNAAWLLRNPPALIMYAVGKGEDLSSCRLRLLKMMASGWSEGITGTPSMAMQSQTARYNLSDLSEISGSEDSYAPSVSE